jgi:hypothetical protein
MGEASPCPNALSCSFLQNQIWNVYGVLPPALVWAYSATEHVFHPASRFDAAVKYGTASPLPAVSNPTPSAAPSAAPPALGRPSSSSTMPGLGGVGGVGAGAAGASGASATASGPRLPDYIPKENWQLYRCGICHYVLYAVPEQVITTTTTFSLSMHQFGRAPQVMSTRLAVVANHKMTWNNAKANAAASAAVAQSPSGAGAAGAGSATTASNDSNLSVDKLNKRASAKRASVNRRSVGKDGTEGTNTRHSNSINLRSLLSAFAASNATAAPAANTLSPTSASSASSPSAGGGSGGALGSSGGLDTAGSSDAGVGGASDVALDEDDEMDDEMQYQYDRRPRLFFQSVAYQS